MATIKLGPLVSDVRGLVGGAVFSRNKGGAYVKAFTKPTNPSTSAQAAIRGLFGTLMSEWRGLTQGERDTWIMNAPSYPVQNKVGDTSILSGPQLYAKANMTLISSGLPRINTLPPSPVDLVNAKADQDQADANPFTWDSVTPTNLEAKVVITLPGTTAVTTPEDQSIMIYASPPVSKGIKSVRSVRLVKLAAITVNDFDQVGVTDQFTYDIGSLLDARFGLGPNLYNKDSQIVIQTTIFGNSEGIPIPVGNQIYGIQDVAP